MVASQHSLKIFRVVLSIYFITNLFFFLYFFCEYGKSKKQDSKNELRRPTCPPLDQGVVFSWNHSTTRRIMKKTKMFAQMHIAIIYLKLYMSFENFFFWKHFYLFRVHAFINIMGSRNFFFFQFLSNLSKELCRKL